MNALAWLIPCALFLGGLGLIAFVWSIRSGQYRDLEGAAWRALDDDPPLSVESSKDNLQEESSKEKWTS